MNVPPLQPLRITPGWEIGWNTLFELDPTEENVRQGFFGGSTLWFATDEHRRLSIDVEWRPEDDPEGEYILRVQYVPWKRTPKGRRRKNVPIDFGDSTLVHEYRTRSRTDLVRELEAALVTRREWIEHS